MLPGITVTVTQTGTDAMRTETTSGTGDYAFNLLPIGACEIKLELQGFKTQVSQTTLAAGQRSRFDGRLELGSVKERFRSPRKCRHCRPVTVGTLLGDKAIYNVTNTPIFNVPGNALGPPTFGVLSNMGNSIARQMQFAARFTF